ncbi:MAG: AAA family ATPase [Deltaproteobacteria bacterium]|nr:AAA family ATPase [Deltaproteobacteria bacterium]
MLTRLKVKGFKNLQDVDVRFGPFTCIVGLNGVGKSNLFDAIHFLSLLADKTFVEAAAAVRGLEGRMGDVATLFCNDGGEFAEEMSFEAEMIIPDQGTDELGTPVEASHTFLVYKIRLRRRPDPSHPAGPLELTKEEMHPVKSAEASERLGFKHTPAWRHSVVKGRGIRPYIHTANPPETLDGRAK